MPTAPPKEMESLYVTATSGLGLPQTALAAKSPFEMRVNLGRNVPEADVRTALATGEMGFLHSFTTGSTVDGPGVRLVAWTSGCMWRCLYCHNPDTWTLTNGVPVTLARATDQLEKYSQGLRIMAGGFTLSGGEALMQDRFAVRLLSAARELGIHTALDTNGYYGDRLSDSELEVADLVILDIKAWTPERHRQLTGMEIGPTLEFARRLAARRRSIWLRFVLVPGWSDAPAESEGVARFAASLGNVERVDVLPFHQMGRFKWQELGLEYRLHDVVPPSREMVGRACASFRAVGLNAH
jgi:pyruvate formate lyase activating enzyme